MWCVSKLFSLYKNSEESMLLIFTAIAESLLNTKNDLTVALIATQCLHQIGEKLHKNEKINKEILEKVLLRLIDLLSYTDEDTVSFPIDCIISLSKINNDAAMVVPSKASKKIIDIYSENFNHPSLGIKLLSLIRLWCEDERCSKLMVHLFVPFSIYVFDDFFKSLKGSSKGFEEVKKTVITEHGDMDFKTNLEMLPVRLLYFSRTS